jgi:hypothetical protein
VRNFKYLFSRQIRNQIPAKRAPDVELCRFQTRRSILHQIFLLFYLSIFNPRSLVSRERGAADKAFSEIRKLPRKLCFDFELRKVQVGEFDAFRASRVLFAIRFPARANLSNLPACESFLVFIVPLPPNRTRSVDMTLGKLAPLVASPSFMPLHPNQSIFYSLNGQQELHSPITQIHAAAAENRVQELQVSPANRVECLGEAEKKIFALQLSNQPIV